MITKMVTKFKRTVVNSARPNQMQTRACAWIHRRTKKLWKIRTGRPGLPGGVGHGPLDRGPAFGPGPLKAAAFNGPTE